MNKNTSSSFPWVVILASIVCLVGVSVMVGWHLHLESWIRIHPKLVPMVYNTALSLFFSGMALLALHRNNSGWAALLATIPFVFGVVNMAQYVFDVDFGIDQLLMAYTMQSGQLAPGRMASSTAFCFIVFTVAVISFYFSNKKYVVIIRIVSGLLMMAIGAFAMFGYFISLYTQVPWGHFASMALHTALSMILLGGCLVRLGWGSERSRDGHDDQLFFGYLRNISIKSKVKIVFIFLIVSYLITLIFFGFFYFDVSQNDEKKDNANETVLRIFDLSGDVNEINRMVLPILYQDDAQGTLANLTAKTVSTHSFPIKELSIKMLHIFDDLKIIADGVKDGALIKKIEMALYDYNSKILIIYDLRKTVGFNADDGLMGEMRQSIHQVEESIEKYVLDVTVNIPLLQMRRYEKDFIQREDLASLNKFDLELTNFKTAIMADDSNPEVREEILSELDSYQRNFKGIIEKILIIRSHISEFEKIYINLVQLMGVLTLDINKQTDQYNLFYQGRMANATGVFLMLFTMVSGLVMYLTYLFFQSLIIPMLLLKESAVRIAHGEYDIDITQSGSDEIGQMAEKLQMMKETMRTHQHYLEEKIRIRTEHLEFSNRALSDTIDELTLTQNELIHSEKMASLGRLVSGFAHEINTPIGIGITTMSTLPALTEQLNQMLEQESVDEDELNACLLNLRKNAELGLRNLLRTADLVTRFKRTSVDQSSLDIRRCNLLEILTDMQASVAHLLKKTKILVEIECPDHLIFSINPGFVAQILTNLIMNSIKHGFEGGKREGVITIRVWHNDVDNHLHFKYLDNGCGIAADVLPKIFEPFFTTARDSDGSGLGLYVVYGIVTAQLKGEISCQSTEGEGVVFDIHFPLSQGRGEP
ncbi:MAG: hypothetical protein HQL94_06115 [Magnetococcales bacterium]|nr:hypothetical protein [Magnetococcales bacterium]